mmetsp:Transcript_15336/g.23417  ORF Transcript_15336/g.23417 Transcript_15336/m.23417 type:complete len:400 (+) Transcript_15336:94-1293(+)|eukprot:CAMPEP_0206472248 /NCGR_PEP_ID=MMETSP0324_2-20121206/32076_1 /ASSEMBLY_ACC=CAM_ASM_000836 /TAXON_ID=2866 /ORGANISM="Crypthecodinium cohnii, Strain Seligo" /LENGTH=399 /DNA_ID=CAMNT_0053946789 /DNA_START=118 /DNA_END=1317 /DNA_ORIENTATION=-
MSTGPGSNPYAANRHADVLNEEPTDETAKLRLVEEIKNRAKGAFAQKDMPSAELLYGKAISVLATLPGKQEATLFSNRAMVRLNLNKVEESLEDSKKCLELDPKFVKAWHRKAQALIRLNEWDDAIAAAEEGLKIEPENKAFVELKEKAQKDKEKDAEDKAKLKRDAQDVRVELHNASTARAPPQKKEKKEGEDGDDVDTSMRGYKVRADGKKTSYFHTDISEEAKKLIEQQGFGKPQKLETAPAEVVEVKGGGSQWNQAGTYEEKNMSKWVDERMKEALKGITFEVPAAGGGTITTSQVTKTSGDASISVSRGKRRYLLDLSVDVEFEGTVGDCIGKGTLKYTEVSTADDEPEVTMEIAEATPQIREVFNAFVKPAGQGLQPLVMKELKKVVEEYKTK